MSFLKQNLEKLKDYDLNLYNRTLNWLDEIDKDNRFFLLKAKDGSPTLQYKDSNGNTKMVTSAYDPLKEGKSLATRQKKSENYVVFGLGLGYHLPPLLDDNVNLIIVIEPSKEVFCLALKNIDLRWLFEGDFFDLSIAESDIDVANRFLRIIKKSSSFEYLTLPGYKLNFDEDYLRYQKLINETIAQEIININTFTLFGQTWTRNFFENLNKVTESLPVHNLFNKFKGIPAVIISAGPSLNKNIHLLKDLKGRAVLIAVGTAYKALKKHNIEPDFITSCDGGEPNYRHFKDLKIENIPLVYDPVIHYKILKEYKGPLVAANISNIFLSWFEEKLDFKTGNLSCGSSIANVSLDFAYKLGADPIIFVGQDLAYTDGRTHAEGTTYEKNRVEASKINASQVYVTDINGEKVLSSRTFQAFLRWFENFIEKRKDKVYIDATEGGARIEGTEIIPLKGVIEKYCQNVQPIKDIIAEFINKSSPINRKDEIIELLDVIVNDLEEFKEIAGEGLNLVYDLKLLYQKQSCFNKVQKILNELDSIDERLLAMKDSKVFLQIIFQPLIKPLLNGSDTRGFEGETDYQMKMRILKRSKNLYEGLTDISKRVLNMVKSTKEDLLTVKTEVF